MNDMQLLANMAHQVYSVLDDIAFRQLNTNEKGSDDYLVFTGVQFKCKCQGRLFGVNVDAEMTRIKIDELDESEEVPF